MLHSPTGPAASLPPSALQTIIAEGWTEPWKAPGACVPPEWSPLAIAAAQRCHDWPDAMAVVSARTFAFVDVNEQLSRATGFAREELIGKRPIELGFWGPEVGAAVGARFLTEGRIQGMELTLRTKPGDTVEVLMSAAPVTVGEEPCFLVITRDISDRRRAERAIAEGERFFRNLVETACEGIWLIDTESRTTFVNRRMAAMLGYEVDDMAGAPLFDFMDADRIAIAQANLERRRQGINEQHEFVFRTREGGRLVALLSTRALMNDDGSYAGALAMVTDITAWEAAEEETRRARADAAVLRERERIAQELHDDVAQNFFAIGLAVRMALSSTEYARPVAAALQTVRDLAAAGALKTREAVLALTQPRLEDDIDQSLSGVVARFASESGLACRFDPRSLQGPPADPPVVHDVTTAARELLMNAWKHGHARRVTVVARSTKEAISLRVSDDGDGDAATVRNAMHAGKGYGLTQLDRRLRAEGGRLSIRRRRGGGLAVTCRWPRAA